MAIVKNTGGRDIDLHHPSFDPITVPMAVEGKNAQGDTVLIEGSARVPNAMLLALAANNVVKHHFETGTLKSFEDTEEETVNEEAQSTNKETGKAPSEDGLSQGDQSGESVTDQPSFVTAAKKK